MYPWLLKLDEFNFDHKRHVKGKKRWLPSYLVQHCVEIY